VDVSANHPEFASINLHIKFQREKILGENSKNWGGGGFTKIKNKMYFGKKNTFYSF
jgi:hypothetical protein